jgi:hypothetical protein
MSVVAVAVKSQIAPQINILEYPYNKGVCQEMLRLFFYMDTT